MLSADKILGGIILMISLSSMNIAHAKCSFSSGMTTIEQTFDFSSLADLEGFYNSSNITKLIQANDSITSTLKNFVTCTANEKIFWQFKMPVRSGGQYGYTMDIGDTTGNVSFVLRAAANSGSLIYKDTSTSEYFPLSTGGTLIYYQTSPGVTYTTRQIIDQYPRFVLRKIGDIKDNLVIPSGTIFDVTTSDGLTLVRITSTTNTKINAGTCELINPVNQVYEFTNVIAPWKTPIQIIGDFSGDISIPIELSCRNKTLVPSIRFTAETGVITSTVNGKSYLKTTGTAKGIGIYAMPNKGTESNHGLTNTSDFSDVLSYDWKFNGTLNDSANLAMYISANLIAIEKWDNSYAGDFEAVLGYDVIYP
jgi:hypothetical protein